MKTMICRLAISAVVLASMLATDCPAQWPYGQLGFGGVGYGYQNYYGYRGNIPTPPYFAIHPPVFYGERVERSYGISPFAALPPMHSELAKPRNNGSKAMVMNPYCTETIEEITPVENQVSQIAKPKVIFNPFVAGAGSIAKSEGTDLR